MNINQTFVVFLSQAITNSYKAFPCSSWQIHTYHTLHL